MTIERTFAMIKPDAVAAPHVSGILSRIEMEGLTIQQMRMFRFTSDTVDAFYAEHKGRFFFRQMKEALLAGPAIGMVLEGKDAVAVWRRLLGPTNPKAAAFEHDGQYSSTIRACFGDLSPGAPVFRNAAHGSDGTLAAEREIAMFETDFDPRVDWTVEKRPPVVGGECPHCLHRPPLHEFRCPQLCSGSTESDAFTRNLRRIADDIDREGGAILRVEALVQAADRIDQLSQQLVPRVATIEQVDGAPERDTLAAIAAEVVRARQKFPGSRFRFPALLEEVGELAGELLNQTLDADKIRKEAIQIGCCIVRFIEENDATSYQQSGLVVLAEIVGSVAQACLQRSSSVTMQDCLKALRQTASAMMSIGDPTFADITDEEAKP